MGRSKTATEAGGTWLSARAMSVVLVILVVVAACGRGEDRPIPMVNEAEALTGAVLAPPRFLRATADGVVTVEMREFRYTISPSVVTGPKIYLLVSNRGRLKHELELSRADYPGIGSERRVMELPPLAPKGYVEFGVDLTGGRYVLRCELPFGRTSDGQLGMVTELTVVEGRST